MVQLRELQPFVPPSPGLRRTSQLCRAVAPQPVHLPSLGDLLRVCDDFGRNLIGLEREEGFAFAYELAGFLVPGRDNTAGDRFTYRGNFNFNRHRWNYVS